MTPAMTTIRSILAVLALTGSAACAGAPEAPEAMPPATALAPLPASAFDENEMALTPQALQADFHALYNGLKEAHYDLYARQSQTAYDALFETMLAGLDRPLRPSEAAIVFQRFAAFGNIAHARLDAPNHVWSRYRNAGGAAAPIFLRIRDGRIFVTESYDDNVAPGDEILAIEGRPAQYWLKRLGRNIAADSPYLAATQLEFSFPRILWHELGAVSEVAFDIRRDGARKSVRVATIDAETLQARADRNKGRFFALDSNTRRTEMLEGDIAYLYPGPFYAVETPETMWDPSAFALFIDQSFETFLDANAKALIIDLRDNPGGDNSFSDVMVAWFADEPFRFASQFLVRSSRQSEASNQARIDAFPQSAEGVSGLFAEAYASTPYGETFPFEIPEAAPRSGARFDGPVFALIDRYSYSNAASVAALLQDYGFAVILGEETSDLPTSYGAMESFTLPNSGLVVGYPKALIIRPSGDMSDRGVVPDIAIGRPVFSETDVVLDTALEIVREQLK